MKKFIIDADIGVDDALAVIMALSSDDVEVLAITCCHGNTPLRNVLKNTLRVLKVCGKPDIPIGRGARDPLVCKGRDAGDYHGKDGLGEVPDPDAPCVDEVKLKKSAQTIIQLVNENPDEVYLVALGPLTNLAMVVNLDPNISKKLKALYLMGGNENSRGNTTSCGEFNFVADPEAARVVLDRYTCPTYIVTWEFTCRNSLPWAFYDRYVGQDTDKAKFVKAITEFSVKKSRSPEYQKETTEGKGFNPCDAFAMAIAIDDTLIKESEEVAVSVELSGNHTRGMMVLDYLEELKKDHKANIIKKVDMAKMKQMLMQSLK